MPVLVAPFAGDTRYHPDGFLGVLNACAEHGVFAVVPELASWTFEDLARQVPNAARIAQVSLLGTEDDFKRLARRIAGAGYAAVCATVDTPVVGLRRRTHRPDPTSSTYVPPVNFAPEFGIDAARYFAGAHTPRHDDWTWTQLGAACAEVGVPFLVKGVLTPEDARAAADAGAVAVYVSNHGGRQLDSAPATLDQLPKIAEHPDRVRRRRAQRSGRRQGAGTRRVGRVDRTARRLWAGRGRHGRGVARARAVAPRDRDDDGPHGPPLGRRARTRRPRPRAVAAPHRPRDGPRRSSYSGHVHGAAPQRGQPCS